MSILDDMVKNQFGGPLSDAIQSVILSKKERSADEALLPIVNEFGKTLQSSIIADKGIIDPSKSATIYQNYLTKLLSAGGGDTQSAKRAQEGMKSIAEAILSGSQQTSEQNLRGKQGEYYTAQTGKLNNDVSIANSPAPDRLRRVTATPEGTTLAQAEAVSQAESRYLQNQTEQLRLSLGGKPERDEDARVMSALLVKHSGKKADELPKDLAAKLANQSLSVRDIAKIIAGKNASPDDYESAKEAVAKAYAEFSSGKGGTGSYPVEQQVAMDKYQVDAATYHNIMAGLSSNPNYMVASPAGQAEMQKAEFANAQAAIAGKPQESPVVMEIRKERERKALLNPAPADGRVDSGVEAVESKSFYEEMSKWFDNIPTTKNLKKQGVVK